MGLIGYWLYEKREPTTYHPYLPTNRSTAYKRLAEIKGEIIACPPELAVGELDVPWLPSIGGRVSGLGESVGSCFSYPDRKLTIGMTGDSPEYVYSVDAASRGAISAMRKRTLVEAAAVAAGGLPAKVVDALVASNGGTDRDGESFKTERAEATISRGADGGWTVEVVATDAEILARVAGSMASIASERLARNFAPVFHFTKDEAFRPVSIDALRGVARLCKKNKGGRRVKPESCEPLRTFPTSTPCGTGTCNEEWVVDLPPDEYDPQGYVDIERDLRRGEHAKPVVYWHVADLGFRRVLSYWVYYVYNRFANLHEGDWESVQVDLIGSNDADSVGVARWFFSSHEGGDTEPCTTISSDCRHPDVFVAKGSHANYFRPGSHGAVATCTKGHRCIKSPRPDRTEMSANPLELGEYLLVELKDPPFVGRYGRANLQSNWVKPLPIPDSRWAWDAPNDPRVRNVWRETPLASFEEAVGDEPPARTWTVLALIDD